MKRIFSYIGLTVLVIALVLLVAPKPKYQEENPWLANDGVPLVMAHGGGKAHNPENTMRAFDYSYNLGVDVLEMDLMMTSDRILVLRHGENNTGNIRLMSNCDTVIWKETYEDLYNDCNFGYNFEQDGTYPYRDMTHEEWVAAGVHMTTLEEVFDAYGDTILYNIEIKADADAWRTETADELYTLIAEYNLFDYILVATSFEDISSHIATEYPELQLSASHAVAQDMIIKTYSYTNLFFTPGRYSALQIPTSYTLPVINELDLSRARLVRSSHRQNVAVHYWTINDEDEMRRLIELGADGIITDYPDLLIEIINTMD